MVFSPDLQEVKRLIKFDWGVATISDLRVLPDGDLIVAGQSQQALQDSLLNSLPHTAITIPQAWKQAIASPI